MLQGTVPGNGFFLVPALPPPVLDGIPWRGPSGTAEEGTKSPGPFRFPSLIISEIRNYGRDASAIEVIAGITERTHPADGHRRRYVPYIGLLGDDQRKA